MNHRLYVSALFGFPSIGAYRNPQPCCAGQVSRYDMATLQQWGSAWGDLRGFRGATRHQLSGTLSYLPGRTIVRAQRTVNFAGAPSSGTLSIRVEPYGSTPTPSRHVVNLRGSRRLVFGGKKLSLNADLLNLLNTNVAWSQTFVSGPSYGFVTDITQSRVLRFSADFEF